MMGKDKKAIIQVVADYLLLSICFCGYTQIAKEEIRNKN